ncbi:hypothetical protein C8Q72DRAFT_45702 [Fomitopsis betulina]|nr:hypothetical protein C8Q72DRAFT_45702 [Fomitopsis betulina]
MHITLSLHYRSPKTKRMNEIQDDATRCLEEFVKDDLRFLGLPAPGECKSTQWRSGLIQCRWIIGKDSYLQRYIRSSFEGIRGDTLPERSISMIGLYTDGKQHWVPAPGVKAPFDSVAQSGLSDTREAYLSWHRKAPGVTSTVDSGRNVAVHTYRPSRAVPGSESPPYHPVRRSSSPRAPRERYRRSPPPRFAERDHTRSGDVDRSRTEHQVPRSPESPSVYRRAKGVRSDDSQTSTGAPIIHAKAERSSDKEPIRTKTPDLRGQNACSATRSSDVSPSNTTSAQTVAFPPSGTNSTTQSSDTSPVTSGTVASDPTRGLWDLRHEMFALSAREEAVTHKLQKLGVRSSPRPLHPRPAELELMTEGLKTMEDEIWELRAQVKAASNARTTAEQALEAERRRREHAEAALENIRSECYVPFVAPAIMDAFMQISHFTDKLVCDM